MYRMLAASLGDLEQKGLMDEHAVQIRVMNPKSIYMGQLYGMVSTSRWWGHHRSYIMQNMRCRTMLECHYAMALAAKQGVCMDVMSLCAR